MSTGTGTGEHRDLAAVGARFAARLRAVGVPVAPDRTGRFAKAIELAAPATTEQLYWIGRVTLVSDPGSIATYERVFDDVFRGLSDIAADRGDPHAPDIDDLSAGDELPDERDDAAEIAPDSPRPAPHRDGPGDAGTDDAERDAPVGSPAASSEILRRRDFAECTPAELRRLRELVGRMRVSTPQRPSRRRRPSRAGDSIDRRATLRRARRTGGQPFELARRTETVRRRRVILIADVSGSMEAYARAYLYLLHGAVLAMQAETFVFATRLTRITRSLRAASPATALADAVGEVADWSGGTRIGAAIKAFNDGWGRRGVARGAVVVIVSDGWEGDDPALLGEQMERLGRLAHRIVWVNPRAQSERYRPLAGGMAAALPHVDVFTSGHSLDALDAVVAAIGAD